MAYSITHRSGAMESNPPIDALDALLAELDYIDQEHPDVAVSHESGWTLSAFPSGRLIYENVENLDLPARQVFADRAAARGLFGFLAAGDVERLEAERWEPYVSSGDIPGH